MELSRDYHTPATFRRMITICNRLVIIVAGFLLLSAKIYAQPQWPLTLTAKNGAELTIYQPQPMSFKDNVIESRAAISVMEKPGADLIFGAIWVDAKTSTDRDSRMVKLESVKVKRVKLPDLTDTAKIAKISAFIESEIMKSDLKISMDQLLATLEEQNPQKSENLKNDPPKIIFSKENTLLVNIDGEPKVQKDEKANVERVINTAFLIIKNPEDKKFYLMGGKFWYVSNDVKGEYKHLKTLPKSIKSIDDQIKEQEKKKVTAVNDTTKKGQTPARIIIATEQTELIQTDGEPVLKPIAETSLLFAENTTDNLFMEIGTQQYYILLAGRWYKSAKLESGWEYVAPEKLPADFSKIPEGTPKDEVLASVPGTDAANEAILDAQVPQTAKVDRKEATCTVTYNGEPEFEKIEGTSLSLAKNTTSKVFKSGNKYYCVENGIWFQASSAKGPWVVSDERPKDIDDIPPSSSAYNTKYVYVYETTPEYVYVGYTPGYMGAYVYGPTVVYGTGYYYNPWYGPYYYPPPITFGFSMHYNPWYGWSMGFGYSTGCFSFSMHFGGYGGYWGCGGGYHPPYHHHHGGYYGHGGYHGGHNNINIDRSNNIYVDHRGANSGNIDRGDRGNRGNSASQQPAGGRGDGVGGDRPSAGQQPAGGRGDGVGGDRPSAGQQPATGGGRGDGAGGDRPSAGQQPAGSGDGTRGGATQQPAGGKGDRPTTGQQPAGGTGSTGRPSTGQQPSTGASTRPNNVYTDRDGNVYQRNNDGSVQQRQGNQWQNSGTTRPSNTDVNRQQQQRDRGQMRDNNYNQQRSNYSRPSGGSYGGSRPSGGSYGGSRGGGGGGRGGGRR